ncbi:MAG: type IV secretory system conjugative DNA transfer family protein, partial [Candidatus Binatia bacterium]
ALNILEKVPPDRRPLLVSSVISIFQKLFGEHWQHRQEHILRNVLLALVEREDEATLLDVYRMLTDWQYRKTITEGINDPIVKSFWINEFLKYMEQTRGDALTPLLNKLGAFVTSPLMRSIIGQPWNTVDFRQVIDEGKILLVDLSKGRVGEDVASFLGAVIVTKLQLAAMSRIDVPEDQRRDFYLYVDEFQNSAATSFIGLLSEARKYRLSVILAHQYLGQLEDDVRESIFGNVGTIISFRVGAEDAKYLAREFYPALSEEDFVHLPPYHIYLRLMIDGVMSRGFSARTYI